MNSNRKKEVYFHVGLGKTASKYLQNKVFPKLEGIYYVKHTRYKNYRKLISEAESSKILVSREFDNQLEDETNRFAEHYPNARIIIILRRHDLWIASQYRRFVKNGYAYSFNEFFDIENDEGEWKQNKLFFMPKLMHLERLFKNKPLVLFHEDLKNDPREFIQKIIRFTGATCDMNSISLKPVHTSYNDKQLKVIQKFSRLFDQHPVYSENPVVNWLQRRPRFLASYFILYPALLLPQSLVNSDELIPSEILEKIRKRYADDWNQCQEYVRTTGTLN